ncbi:MAG: hypothetical protein PHI98_05700 [Eubacteriales bacterium]|nr:hypothetical protein [Eubacteriales bacterium]
MTIKHLKRMCAALCCVCVLLLTGSALGQGIELNAAMGYDGAITYLRRLPVFVEITNNGGDTSGVLCIDVARSSVEYDRYSTPLTIAAGSTVAVTMPVQLSMKQSAYTVKWMENGLSTAETEIKKGTVFAPSTIVIGVLSPEPEKLSYLNITQAADPLKRGEIWQTVALDQKSFPAAKADMDFFDMLVVDGVDMGSLSTDQTEALDGWLRNGGVVLVGGGAEALTSFPYFSAYTGIAPGTLSSKEGLSGELLDWFGLKAEPSEGTAAVVELRGAAGTAIGEETLVDVTKVDGGYVLTAGFSLSEKPLSTWMGRNAIWQRVMLGYALQRYTSIVNQRVNGSNGNDYVDYEVLNQIPVANTGAMSLPVILLAAFVLLVGFGSYWILKKLDKREWMWVTVPSLCVLCSLAIWGASILLNLQKPIAVSYTMLELEKDGNRNSFTAVGVAQADAGRMEVTLQEGNINTDSYSSYYYDGGNTQGEPSQTLRYEYTLGGLSQMTFQKTQTWEQNSFMVSDAPLRECSLTGFAGWENNRLSFTVTNQSSIPLSDGLIMTDYGYVSVPVLLPGQTLTAEMSPDDELILDADKIKDGMLLSDSERRNFGFYDYLNSYWTSTKQAQGESDSRRSRQSLLQTYGNSRNWYSGIGDPCYIAFSDELAQLELLVNGQLVSRSGQMNMVSLKLSMNPIAKDGTVHYLSGTIPVYAAELNRQAAPVVVDTGSIDRYTSFRLMEEPIFAFDLSDVPKDWTLEHFDISPRNAYYGYQVELYRVKDGEWVNIKTHEIDMSTNKSTDRMAIPKLGDYTDQSGYLFARFVGINTNDTYAEISQPELTMDGRLN